MNLQIETSDVDALYASVRRSDLAICRPLEVRSYRHDQIEWGSRQFVVADPDGYLLRFFSSLGDRPARSPSIATGMSGLGRATDDG